MKNLHLIILLFGVIFTFNAQNDEVQFKLDSILQEADLIYQYEKAVWESTDLLLTHPEKKNDYGGYVVWDSNDSIFVTYFNQDRTKSIARYIYKTNNYKKPASENLENSNLIDKEKSLFDIKLKMAEQLSDEKYEIGIPEGFNPNLVLIQDGDKYRLYILMGTFESGVVPLGNDYIFEAGKEGKITHWQKYHTRVLPISDKGPKGEKIISATHSHLRTTPYITATEIATFRLYGDLVGVYSFSIYSTASGEYYSYDLKNNSIKIAMD